MKNLLIGFLILIFAIGIVFGIFCGIFVIQPIGAIPNGATIIYWRHELNMPFIASADGLILDSGKNVTLMWRALVLAGLTDILIERKIFRLNYSERL